MSARPGRNDPCPCGSGQKYKRCCLEQDEAARSAELAARAAAAATDAASAAEEAARPGAARDAQRAQSRAGTRPQSVHRPPAAARRRSV
jgi:hypothetical protein